MSVQPAIARTALPVHKPNVAAPHLKLLVYGHAGVGKTWLAGTAEDDERTAPVLFCDTEKGTMTIRHRGRALDVVNIADFKADFTRIVGYLRSKDNQYRCIVVESLTEVQRLNFDSITGDTMDRRDWGTSLKDMLKLLRALRDLPVHLIVTAMEREVREESTGITTTGPSLLGQLGEIAPAVFDIVGRLYVVRKRDKDAQTVTDQRRMTVSGHGSIVAKDRTGKLGREVIEPTITKLLDAYNVM